MFDDLLAKAQETPKLGDIISKLHACAVQAHIWHLQTKSYAEHMALGQYYENLTPLIDRLGEAWLSREGTSLEVKKIELKNLGGHLEYYMEAAEWMRTSLRFAIPAGSPDLTTIADEILEETNKLIYLLKLK